MQNTIKLAKIGNFIYNILSINRVIARQKSMPGNRVCCTQKGGKSMFNMYNKKTRRIVSSVIIAILIIAMIVPTLSYLIG